MARKLKKKIKLILIVIIGVLLVGGSLFIFKDKIFTTDNKTEIKKITTKKEVEVWPKVYTASMVATGDLLLHNAVYLDGYDKTTDTFNYDDQLKLLTDIIPEYDIAYYNQETLFGGRRTEVFSGDANQVNGYSSYPYFNSPSEYGDAMIKLGFNTVSLASNHSADCKSANLACLNNSYSYWASKDVVFDGFNENEEKINTHNTGEVNNITYGFLNYTNTLNGLDSTVANFSYLIDKMNFVSGDENGCSAEGYTYSSDIGMCVSNNVVDEITELRSKVDVLIVAMHWHYSSAEYSTTPTVINQNIAKFLNSLGVDIIVGTYSHCLQPFDIIESTDTEGNTHKTVVYYSLGNFVSNQVPAMMGSIGTKGQIGVLASLNITKTVEKDGTTTIEIGDLGADLLYTYKSPQAEFTVVPFSKMTTEYISDETYMQNLYTEYTGYLTSLNQNITIKAIGSANTQN